MQSIYSCYILKRSGGSLTMWLNFHDRLDMVHLTTSTHHDLLISTRLPTSCSDLAKKTICTIAHHTSDDHVSRYFRCYRELIFSLKMVMSSSSLRIILSRTAAALEEDKVWDYFELNKIHKVIQRSYISRIELNFLVEY